MWLANFANDASSMVHLRSSPWHITYQPYGRLSIVVHYPSVSIRAAQSGLQSAPACRMRWGCHHLSRSYDRNLSNIANIGLYSVSGHTLDANILQNLDIAKYLNEINIIIGQIILNPPTCQNIQDGGISWDAMKPAEAEALIKILW